MRVFKFLMSEVGRGDLERPKSEKSKPKSNWLVSFKRCRLCSVLCPPCEPGGSVDSASPSGPQPPAWGGQGRGGDGHVFQALVALDPKILLSRC